MIIISISRCGREMHNIKVRNRCPYGTCIHCKDRMCDYEIAYNDESLTLICNKPDSSLALAEKVLHKLNAGKI